MFENIKCPKCGENYYKEYYSTRTAMYYPPIYKDGININLDGNITTKVCQCMNCDEVFSFQVQYGKVLNNV